MECEQRRIDLMRIKINLCTSDSARKLVHAVWSATLGQFIGKIFGVVIRCFHYSFYTTAYCR